MKKWQVDSQIDNLSASLADPLKTETKFSFDSFSEPERQLLDKVQEILDSIRYKVFRLLRSRPGSRAECWRLR